MWPEPSTSRVKSHLKKQKRATSTSTSMGNVSALHDRIRRRPRSR
jgi:hypothetical protein